MAYDLEEQEQIESLKAWWKQYGNLVTWGLIVAMLAYSAWQGWQYYQRRQAGQASQLYSELQKAVGAKDQKLVLRAASDMREKFKRTPYAQMAGMAAAKTLYESGDLKAAKAQLTWVSENAIDDEYKAIAKIRLAGICLDEKDYDAGLALVSAEYAAPFSALAADRKGDILLAQNKVAEARVAYEMALEKTEKSDPGRQLIQLKLDGIGGISAKPTA